MTANKTLLQRKYSRIISLFAEKADLSKEEALEKFYHSKTYDLVSQGVSDLHCRSDLYIVDELLIEYGYEKSAYVKGNGSNKAVALKPSELKGYDDHDFDSVNSINSASEKLEEHNLVRIEYQKDNTHLIHRICLNLNNISAIYQYAQRQPVIETRMQLMQIIEETRQSIRREWIMSFLCDEYDRLTNKRNCLVLKNITEARDLCKVLLFIDNSAPALMRNISTRCYNDSKYLERNIRNKLISIAKKYEPDINGYFSENNNTLTDNQILEQIGIITYPEIFELCGNASFVIGNTVVDMSCFNKGFCLQSETVADIQQFNLEHIRRILFIENRTTYLSTVLCGIHDNMLVIYHGGFYSPLKGELIRKLYNASENTKFMFWGDIDLGGFVMYERLKKNIILELKPYRMDTQAYSEGKNHGLARSADYCNKLREYLSNNPDSIFKDVIEEIIKNEKTVEQEVLKPTIIV